jgi:hypothetical protein
MVSASCQLAARLTCDAAEPLEAALYLRYAISTRTLPACWQFAAANIPAGGKPEIFGPLILLGISVVELFHYLQSIVVKTALDSFLAANHAT